MYRPQSCSEGAPESTDVDQCVAELRDALASHGITLPSLGIDLPSFAARPPLPLVALGNCNTATVRKLTAALRATEQGELEEPGAC